MAEPIFGGLCPNHRPPKTTWSFYIALPSLSSNSAHEARMRLLLKIFASVIVQSAGRQRGMLKANYRLLVTACTHAKSAD